MAGKLTYNITILLIIRCSLAELNILFLHHCAENPP